ncbi:hypothetical protein HYPSUDRAFT_209491 [Hypholoma sublateritium FD-334 SS-4]|uniref:Zn(2)-C6 fungal-type domain-containing protein n=1 Tax=Hypholoma sublateritium (strain FD-334 SS-4) TaxID=945553 RepID=A0A0D2NA58_HYPSF|nr:hypothetical protein HYPSUDRAFT_209491 [Hypholoma sublateritium FD-334 SS-4]
MYSENGHWQSIKFPTSIGARRRVEEAFLRTAGLDMRRWLIKGPPLPFIACPPSLAPDHRLDPHTPMANTAGDVIYVNPRKSEIAASVAEPSVRNVHERRNVCDRCRRNSHRCYYRSKGRSNKCVRCQVSRRPCSEAPFLRGGGRTKAKDVEVESDGEGGEEEEQEEEQEDGGEEEGIDELEDGADEEKEEEARVSPATPPAATGSKRHRQVSPENTSGPRPSKRATQDTQSNATGLPLFTPRSSCNPSLSSLPSKATHILTQPQNRSPALLAPGPHSTRNLDSPQLTESHTSRQDSRSPPVMYCLPSVLSTQPPSNSSAERRRNAERMHRFVTSARTFSDGLQALHEAEHILEKQRIILNCQLDSMAIATDALYRSAELCSSFTKQQVYEFQASRQKLLGTLSGHMEGDTRVIRLAKQSLRILDKLEG